jgi:pentatricopeptide repeat protein
MATKPEVIFRAAIEIASDEERAAYIAKACGDDPELPLAIMSDLPVSCVVGGHTAADALKVFEQTLQLQKARFGTDHPGTLMCMGKLADWYLATSRPQDAIKLDQETLQLKKSKLGPDHPDTLASMIGLSNSYAAAGRTHEALKLREETFQLAKAKHGADHPATLTSMHDLASSYADAGRAQEALGLREETLRLAKAKLGPDHPAVLMSMNSLANSYTDAGRTQEALKLFEEMLQRQRHKLGLDHADTLRIMNSLAISYIAEGQIAKAVAILQETLALRKRRVKADPGNSVEQSFLAWTHGQMGEAERMRLDYAAAVRCYGTSVEMLEKLDHAGALKDPVFEGSLKPFRQRLALCRKAEQAVKDLDFALSQPAREVLQWLDVRVRFLLKEHELATAVESAAKMRELAGDNPEANYAAACEYALCAGAAKPAKRSVASAPGSKKLAEEAIALLKQAVAKGFRDVAHMKKDKDLDALRARADFKKVIAELEVAKKDRGKKGA